MSPASARHGELVGILCSLLVPFVRQHKLGRVVAGDAGFFLSRGPDCVRGPDVAFIRSERIPAEGLPARFFPAAPDLAIEVVSPSDSWSAVDEKVFEYLHAGTLEVWLVDAERRSVSVCRPSVPPLHLTGEAILASVVLPGFELALRDLF